MSAKRILLFIKSLGRGGAENILVNTVRYGDGSRFDYEVAYVLPWLDHLVPELKALGVQVHCLDGSLGARWIMRLRTLVRERRIDLVHVHSAYPAVGARLGLERRCPIVYTEHNVWGNYHRATYWGNLLTYRRNDHVFAVSEQVRRSARYPGPFRLLPMPTVETLYHGPDPEALARRASPDGVREELGIPADAPIVGTVANFKPHKGHEYLLQAAVRVRQSVPDVRFVLVGLGPLERQLRQRARALRLDETVVFAGAREDAIRVAAAFDLVALSSLREGLPIALIEAMALGKPVAVANFAGLTEVVEHGRQGLVVPTADPGALAEAILRLLENASLRRQFGAAARQRAGFFDIRKAVRRIEEVYEELLA
jgi:glycosyltransferase involved in cell wall biosynthesis